MIRKELACSDDVLGGREMLPLVFNRNFDLVCILLTTF